MNEENKLISLESGDVSDMRFVIEEIIKNLRGPDGRASSRQKSLAITKLEEARFWLGEDLYGGGT